MNRLHLRTDPDRFSHLFLASFLALFMELVFIRWVPSYERVLAYFTNFVLIAAFLGLGLGSILARLQRDLIRYLPLLILGVVLIAIAFSTFVKTGGAIGDVTYSEFGREVPVELKLEYSLALFFAVLALPFVPVGQKIGKELAILSSPIHGYIVNILGSLLGVLAFSGVSFLELSPVWWFAVPLVILVWFSRGLRSSFWLNIMTGCVTVAVVWISGRGFIWSPYHKLVVTPLAFHAEVGVLWPYAQTGRSKGVEVLPDELGFHLAVDDDFLQMALDLSDATLNRHPFLRNYRDFYDLPYSIPGFPYHDILIVGAGTGNDVAAALRHGARRIDAVEIDPAVLRLGNNNHPEKPYSDPNVHQFVDDARSYFNKTSRKYDLIVFGLLDSHRLFSSMSSVRLDSFVFTVESFREVRRLLKPHGLAVVQHGLGRPFLGNRMHRMLSQAFEMPPVVWSARELPGLTFVVGSGIPKFLAPGHASKMKADEVATDDWPFFYLVARQIPREYIVAMLMMLSLSALGVLVCCAGKIRRVDLHFFSLGSAFLLIETFSITRFALLFGSTWLINSIVFFAILLVVLAANLWMLRKGSVDVHISYALLVVALVLNYWFPVHILLDAGLGVRLAAAFALIGFPIFCAAFIFARSFARTKAPELALGSNLLGAVAGGLIEYTTLILGFRAQVLVLLVMYGFSYLNLKRAV